jgi:peptide/nickel transport system substrate-binding protein
VGACSGETVEVPGETVVVEKEVIKEVQVPGETVVVEKEVIKEVMVPGETVVVEKEVIKEVAGKKYVTDPTTGRVLSAPEYGGTLTYTASGVGENARNYPGRTGSTLLGGVAEMLAIADWGVSRDVHDHMKRPVPLWVMKGQLADSWEIKDDGTTFEFSIRDGVNWHDKAPLNGRKFVGNDVVVNYERYFGIGEFCEGGVIPQYKAIPIDSITAPDDSTVVFKLTQPHLTFLDDIFNAYPPHLVPPEAIEKECEVSDWRDVVGTGPFELTEVVSDVSVTWTKFPGYYGFDEKFPENRLPYVDEIRMLAMPDEATRISALRTGKIDYLGWSGDTMVTIDQANTLKETNPEMQYIPYIYRSNGTSFALNLNNPLFEDVRVRKAMQMAQDLETINTVMFGGQAKWQPQGIIGDGASDYFTPFDEWPEEIKKGYTYDPEGAEKLLDEAGYPRGADGIRFKTVYEGGTHFKNLALADVAASYWAAIGVDVEITQATDAAAHNASMRERTYEGLGPAYIGYDRNPTFLMNCYAHSEGGCNRPGSNDPELDALIDAALAATSFEEQQTLVKEADMHQIADHYYVWYLKIPNYNVVQPWLVGYNGEYFLGFQQRYAQIFARTWIDSELKAQMGY